jgi:hypothetical protein
MKRIVPLFLSALTGQVSHIFEEVWGRFWLINAFHGLGWFLLANWILFCIPTILFYFVLLEKRWAYKLSMIYAAVLVVNGIGHNMGTLFTGEYFGGFAGGFTGIAFVFIGPAMIYYLRKEMPGNKVCTDNPTFSRRLVQ